MKLIIDDANIDQIKTIYEYYPVDGVTTNPTILAKSKRAPTRFCGRSVGLSAGRRSCTSRWWPERPPV